MKDTRKAIHVYLEEFGLFDQILQSVRYPHSWKDWVALKHTAYAADVRTAMITSSLAPVATLFSLCWRFCVEIIEYWASSPVSVSHPNQWTRCHADAESICESAIVSRARSTNPIWTRVLNLGHVPSYTILNGQTSFVWVVWETNCDPRGDVLDDRFRFQRTEMDQIDSRPTSLSASEWLDWRSHLHSGSTHQAKEWCQALLLFGVAHADVGGDSSPVRRCGLFSASPRLSPFHSRTRRWTRIAFQEGWVSFSLVSDLPFAFWILVLVICSNEVSRLCNELNELNHAY